MLETYIHKYRFPVQSRHYIVSQPTMLLHTCVFGTSDWRRRGRRRMLRRWRQRLQHVDDGTSSSTAAGRCLMQLVRSAQRRQHRPHKHVDSCPCDNSIAMTSDDHQGDGSSCCRCSDGSGSGSGSTGGGRLRTLVDSCGAGGRCRLPRCTWWKSLCTRVYLIAVNLASFVSSLDCTTKPPTA